MKEIKRVPVFLKHSVHRLYYFSAFCESNVHLLLGLLWRLPSILHAKTNAVIC